MEKKLHFFDPSTGLDRAIDTNQYIGAVVPKRRGGVVAALQDGFYSIDEQTGEIKEVKKLHLSSDLRFNDGKCDPVGRFWAGTMSLDERPDAGAFEPNGTARLVLSPVTVSNGLAWSRDGQTMYYIDSPTGVVMAFSYNLAQGQLGEGRIAVRIPEGEGARMV